ncbi:mitochondrion biogenesis protein [Grosmannia clavigera kw1407]|uniref:Mitochondrion biogenesis protein n=1 Tax=Grosmannia clavigera (strain kw1407 / UAMH 11150) TaxID=655863 RepID=F0XPF3_GROCL|nr:mitochondrion biogenesis protein [Grosmannia clavigera kw1407]EFX00585.1 mitochondrion biogenesis protein [Grosmannia clavigera kw1407]
MMPSSTAKTHQLGRQVWTTVRESLDSWVWHLPSRSPPRSLTGLGIGHSFASQVVSREPMRRSFFHSSSRRLFGHCAPATKISPNNLAVDVIVRRRGHVHGRSRHSHERDHKPKKGEHRPGGSAGLAAAPQPPHAPARTAGCLEEMTRRCESTSTSDSAKRAVEAATPAKKSPGEVPEPPPPPPPQPGDEESIAASMSKYLQSHLPKIPQRPTKEEFMAAATGFWQRLQARFKWHSIRSMRPWNADEWGAFVSWIMLGHLLWILVGTTTFFSIVILLINTVFAQEELAKWVGDYLTQSAGVTVVFESAIVPKWKGGVITFHNVFVSRRPGQVKSSVKKGSSSEAAIAAAQQSHEPDGAAVTVEDHDDGNYTQFDVTINSVDVSLSFVKWWNGKGLLRDVEVKGVRGIIDRTHVQWAAGPLDPLSFRHVHLPGDFEIERFKLEDLMVTVHQPSGFRPFSISIFSCELPQLRKQWLLYDFLSANHVSGSYDGSLFTIHPRQVQQSRALSAPSSVATTTIDDVVDRSHHDISNPANEPVMLESPLAWKKFSRLRIDGLKIDHLNRGDRGPFGWIYEGNVDIVSDVMLPAEADEGIAKAVSDLYDNFYDRMEEAVTSNRYITILDGHYGSRREEEGELPQDEPGQLADASPPQYVVMDLRMHLNDIRAAVPFFPASEALGYVNAALIRPIVAYMNAKRTYIPINCRIVKHLSDFDGSWTIYDCGLMDDSSAEVYAAFAHDVEDQQSRVRRLKKVGFWTLSMVVHAILAGVAGDLL